MILLERYDKKTTNNKALFIEALAFVAFDDTDSFKAISVGSALYGRVLRHRGTA